MITILSNLIEVAEQQRAEVTELRSVDKELLQIQINPKSWSICQVIAHLNLTYGLYLPRLQKALDLSPPLENSKLDHFKISFTGKMMIAGSLPRNGKRRWKIKTFSFFTPQDQPPIDETFNRFFELHKDITGFIKTFQTRDHRDVKVVSAVGPVVKFGVGECLSFLLAHQARHLQQAKEVLAALIPSNKTK